MGGFLTLSGIASVKRRDVERALRHEADTRGGTFERDSTGLAAQDGLAIVPGDTGRLSLVYPAFAGAEQISKHLSKTLNAPVFLFHIHDGDFWMYTFFDRGKKVDHFNPIPDYWGGDLSPHERKRCAGDARKVAKYWPDLKSSTIERYLVSWQSGSRGQEKAYPDDLYCHHDCRQLIDFMRRLGLAFPLDDNEVPIGDLYWFDMPEAGD